MISIGIFEANGGTSRYNKTRSTSREDRANHTERQVGESEIWHLRRRFIEETREFTEDFELPERQVDPVRNPLDE